MMIDCHCRHGNGGRDDAIVCLEIWILSIFCDDGVGGRGDGGRVVVRMNGMERMRKIDGDGVDGDDGDRRLCCENAILIWIWEEGFLIDGVVGFRRCRRCCEVCRCLARERRH